MDNDVIAIALKALKKHEKAISLVQYGPPEKAEFQLEIKGLTSQTDKEEFENVAAALYAIAGGMGRGKLFVTDTTSGPKAHNTEKQALECVSMPRNEDERKMNIIETPSYLNCVLALANRLVDAGINFPGSEAHKSRSKG